VKTQESKQILIVKSQELIETILKRITDII